MVVGAGPATFAPHEVILAVSFQHERTFDISLRSDLLEHGSILKRDQAREIIPELDHIAMTPASIIHVVGSVIIFEHELVDRLGTVDDLVD